MSPSRSSDTNLTTPAAVTWPGLRMRNPTAVFLHPDQPSPLPNQPRPHNLELQLLPASSPHPSTLTPTSNETHTTQLQLSIGRGDNLVPTEEPPLAAKDDGVEQLRTAMEDKARADEARRQTKRNVELAELEFANAQRVRQQARAELDKAYVLRDKVTKQINSILLHITCHDCRQQLHQKPAESPPDDKAAGEGVPKLSDT